MKTNTYKIGQDIEEVKKMLEGLYENKNYHEDAMCGLDTEASDNYYWDNEEDIERTNERIDLLEDVLEKLQNAYEAYSNLESEFGF